MDIICVLRFVESKLFRFQPIDPNQYFNLISRHTLEMETKEIQFRPPHRLDNVMSDAEMKKKKTKRNEEVC